MVWRTLFYTVLAVVLGARVTSQQDCEDFLKRPVDTYARLDESTCLFCDYSESPVNVEDWTLGMSAATDQCDSCVISDGNLCFNGVTADEFATYVCFVQLPFGVQKSCSVNLLQPALAVFDGTQTPSEEFLSGPNPTLTISAVLSSPGEPPAEVYFQRNGVNLTSLDDDRLSFSDKQFTLSGATASDRGLYQIVAENHAGMVVHDVAVTVEFVSIVDDITSVTETNGRITFTCIAQGYPSPDVKWTEGHTCESTGLVSQIDISEAEFEFNVVTHLEVDCEPNKQFRCCLTSGGESTSAGVDACPADPPSPPTISITVQSQSSVEVTWPSVDTASNYTVEWRLTGTGAEWMAKSVTNNPTSLQSVQIPDLVYDSIYEFRARSDNVAGRGQYSLPTTIRIIEGIQEPVLGLQASLISSSTSPSFWVAQLTWQKTNVVSATGYRVHVIPSPGASFVVPIDDVAQTSYMLNVTCEVTYQFKVQVVNENGQGANSSLVTVNECVVIPEPPSNRISFTLSPSEHSVELSWEVKTDSADDQLEKLTIRIQELDSESRIVVTMNYTISGPFDTPTTVCARKLNSKSQYYVCLVGEFKTSIETVCEPTSTTSSGSADESMCLDPSSVTFEERTGDSSDTTEVPDWGIAVIVVGILALVALIFCLIGVCFACQSTKKTGGVSFGSTSDISMRMDGTAGHMHPHRPMSPTRSCLSYHSKGHSTNWSDHVDTLRQLESGAATSV